MVIRTRAALLREPAASASASIGRLLRPAARLLTPPEEIRGRGRAGERRPLSPFSEHERGPLRLRSDRAAELADLLIRMACRSELPVQRGGRAPPLVDARSEEHMSELQSRLHLVCRLLLEKKKKNTSPPLKPTMHDTPCMHS